MRLLAVSLIPASIYIRSPGLCAAVIAGIVSHRVAQTHSRKRRHKRSGCSVHPCRTAPGNRRGGADVLGVIRVNRRITVTVEGKWQRGSLGDDIHLVSLGLCTQAYSLQESLQPTPVRPCSGSTELWKRVKERGSVWPRVKSVRSSQYVLVTGSTGSVTHPTTLLAILFPTTYLFSPATRRALPPAASRFSPAGSPVRRVSPDLQLPSSPAGGRR